MVEMAQMSRLLLGHEMDVRNLSFEDGTFDVAIDKGSFALHFEYCNRITMRPGTMDAMMTAKGDVWVSLCPGHYSFLTRLLQRILPSKLLTTATRK